MLVCVYFGDGGDPNDDLGMLASQPNQCVCVCVCVCTDVKTYSASQIHTISNFSNLRFRLHQCHTRMPTTVASSSRDTKTTTGITAVESTGHGAGYNGVFRGISKWCRGRFEGK